MPLLAYAGEKIMSRIIHVVILAVLVLLGVYFVFGFIAIEYNIHAWSSYTRFSYVQTCCVVGTFVFTAYAVILPKINR